MAPLASSYWYGPNSAGQLVINHGRPRWNGKYGAFLKNPTGNRWRFGENFWTTLDTNIPLEPGSVKIASGSYYLVLQHSKNGLELVLQVLWQGEAQAGPIPAKYLSDK